MLTIKEEVCSFDNLYQSMKKCKNNIMWKDSTQGYYKNGLVNIHELRKSLLNGSYKIDKYTSFKVYEPKERNILATRFKDRVFQRSLCDNYVYKEITKSFIYDNCACQIGKGTEFARKRMYAHMQKFYRKHGINGYVLKLDLKNYFGSTLHSVAKSAVKKRIKDEWACNEVFRVIDSYEGDRGMGLGSQLTQLIQLAVLDDLDHYIKEQLHVKHYIRYMDDMILIHHDKDFLKYCLSIIEKKLTEINLSLNKKKTQIYPLKQGVNFLGFKFKMTETGKVKMTVFKKNIFNEKRKLRKLVGRYKKGYMSKKQLDDCFQSYIAHISNGSDKGKHNKAKRNCTGLIIRMKKYYWKLLDS